MLTPLKEALNERSSQSDAYCQGSVWKRGRWKRRISGQTLLGRGVSDHLEERGYTHYDRFPSTGMVLFGSFAALMKTGSGECCVLEPLYWFWLLIYLPPCQH